MNESVSLRRDNPAHRAVSCEPDAGAIKMQNYCRANGPQPPVHSNVQPPTNKKNIQYQFFGFEYQRPRKLLDGRKTDPAAIL
jgi:hypothetical protein